MHTSLTVFVLGLVTSLAAGAEAQTPALPEIVDLRPQFAAWGLAARQQGDRPTCSAFTVTGAIEFALAKQLEQSTRLSVEFLNWAANQAGGGAADGAFFSDLWKGFVAHGLCAEAEMPYRAEFVAAAQPSPTALTDARKRLAQELRLQWIKEWNVQTGLMEEQLTAIRRTLARGWPVCAGCRWPRQATWGDGVLQMCPPEAVYDGHSVLVVGYRPDPSQPGGGVLLFRNTAGDGRDGAMPYEYARSYMNDAAWVDFESTTADTRNQPAPDSAATTDP